MDIVEAMEARKSVRTFNDKPIDAVVVAQIEAAMTAASCPLPGSWCMEMKHFDKELTTRPGTYGVIKGASNYLLLGYDATDNANGVAAGFAMEQVVLELTRMGLGTCWMAATYKQSDFEREASLGDGMSLRVVIPVGYAAEKQRFIERVTRFTVGSKNRKPLGKMFYVGKWGEEITDASQFYESLMMMRLAPSSTNSQPWRALIKGATVHFYTKNPGWVGWIDMGIGMCHFDEAERYRRHRGEWFRNAASAPEPAEGLVYVASYRRL